MIERVIAEGTAAWPELELAREDVERFLAAHPAADPAAADPGEDAAAARHAADLYLACGCALGDPRALAAFDRHYLGPVGTFVARTDPSPAFAEEVRQALRTRLLVAGATGGPPRIAQYSGKGPLGGFVRIAAVRAALDLQRARRSEPAEPLSDAAAEHAPAAAADPELQLIRARYRDVYERALREALQALEARERTLLRMYFVDGKTIDELGGIYQVHRATAARWVAQARQRVLDDTLHRLGRALGTAPAELESLTALVVSELHVSLGGLIRETR